jgi:hypothetical protein
MYALQWSNNYTTIIFILFLYVAYNYYIKKNQRKLNNKQEDNNRIKLIDANVYYGTPGFNRN